MFKSMPALQSRVKRLLAAYSDWANSTAESFTDNRLGQRPAIGDVLHVRTKLEGQVAEAQSIMADAEFAALTAEEREDVTAIAEEGATAITEIDLIADADEVWETAESHRKRNFANGVRVPLEVADLIVSRIKHDIRKAHPGKPPEIAYQPKKPKRESPVVDVTPKRP